MRDLQLSQGRRAMIALAVCAVIASGCSDSITDPPTALPSRPVYASAQSADIAAAIAAQERHNAALLHIPNVVGTAVGLLPNGKAAIRILLATPGVAGLPDVLDDIPVVAQVTGMIVARSDPTLRQRPAPLGFSVGHPAITAGSIGARAIDNQSRVFVLSNNHVLANSNDATLGDAALQPGPFDGGTSADQIGTLFAFKPIDFSGGSNTFDAAIALSTTGALGNSTPSDDGYGTPNGTIFGDANNDGVFDNKSALLGLNVQKYGRTTKLTKGQITGINATVNVCYEVVFIFCVKQATFVDQLIIEPGTFSGGGDSGSLIVTDNAGANPVALLFAGSDAQTIANRIDLVLNYFAVRIDGGSSPPPGPVTDIAITSVSAPSSVTQGATANVLVTVQNVGNQPVGSSMDVTLTDVTGGTIIGTQTVPGLAASASTTLTYNWNTTGASLGTHMLTASHNFTDDNAANNQRSTNVTIGSTSNVMHVGDLDVVLATNSGTSWAATIEITVHDANHTPLNGATVVGSWSPTAALATNQCTTGDLGGNGTCIVLNPAIKRTTKSVTFKVTSVTMSGRTYSAATNHDPDGDSNGTSIKVSKP
jgi:hypothetical protein